VYFLGSVIISGDNNQFNGNWVGATAGGGAVTVTLPSGGDNNILLGNFTDATISDSGATNTLANNVVY